jgi:thiamine-monophosphate kinase
MGFSDEKSFLKGFISKYATTAGSILFDDCILIDLNKYNNVSDPILVYSVDHPSKISRLLPKELAWRFYGRWVAACTCSDVIAMGAKPNGFSVDLTISKEIKDHQLSEIYEGISDVLKTYDTKFEGGNLDVGESLEIVGFSWGLTSKQNAIRRHGANPGDIIAVTTELGIGWAAHLLREMGSLDELDPSFKEIFSNYNSMPLSPCDPVVESVSKYPKAITSGMDLTDGLIEFLHTIVEKNGLGSRIFESNLPRSLVLEEISEYCQVETCLFNFEPGYDTPRNHCYTISPEYLTEITSIYKKHGWELFAIGQVCEDSSVKFVRKNGKEIDIPYFYDDQFKKSSVIRRWFELIKVLSE